MNEVVTKKEKKLSLILMIIAAIIVFVFGSYIGTIVAIVSLIISIKEFKNKEKLNRISLIGSSIIILYSVISFTIAFVKVNDTLSEARQNARNIVKQQLEYSCKSYSSSMITNGDLEIGENVITTDIMDKYNISYPSDCESYVIANIVAKYSTENSFEAYLKCDGYKTDGFNNNLLK